jgi:hypothetical protein
LSLGIKQLRNLRRTTAALLAAHVLAAGPTHAAPTPAPTSRAAQPKVSFAAALVVESPSAHSFANAWGDYNGDGYLDLAVSLASGEIRLYANERGSLRSTGAQLGLPAAGYEVRGLSWGDFDADGDLDLLGGAGPPSKPTLVLRNATGRFTDAAAAVGLTLLGRSARQTNWVDFDNDGDLDVYAADRQGGNKLFRNERGRFLEVLAQAAPVNSSPTVGACWFDADADGDLDLFVANQSGAADALWRNEGAHFENVAARLGVAGPRRTTDMGGVGCAVGDYDNDGDLDLFVAAYGRNLLYRNERHQMFVEVGSQLGVSQENRGVSADWGDVDNDGDLDLFVAAYRGPQEAPTYINALFRNDGTRGFVNTLRPDSAINRADHGAQFVDYDNDGLLDLSLTTGYGSRGGHYVFRNSLAGSAKQRSLSVLVLDQHGRHTRFGAEVRLYDRQGKLLGTRQVHTGGGYCTQRAAPVHFGLAMSQPVSVEVTFMSKHGRRAQRSGLVSPADYYGKSLIVREQP